MNIPVLLLTSKDRTRYLDTTIKSVLCTLPDSRLLYVCCDNISLRTAEYLTTGNRVRLGTDFAYPNENQDWINRIGHIENEQEVTGLNNRVNVLSRSSAAGHDALLEYLVSVLMMHEGSSHVILIEDDVIFKANWYVTLCAALSRHEECGLIAGFHYPLRVRNKVQLEDITLFQGGYSAVCIGLSAKLIGSMKKQGKAYNGKAMIRQDDWIVENCYRLGLKQGYLNSGVCQHIGVESATWKTVDAKSYYNSRNGLDRIDKQILPPFALGT